MYSSILCVSCLKLKEKLKKIFEVEENKIEESFSEKVHMNLRQMYLFQLRCIYLN